jgi:hypothetical protein
MNEDAVGATGTAAWVIDGATGVSDRAPLVAGITDPAWLAGQLNDKLSSTFQMGEVHLPSALAKIEAEIQAGFAAIDLLPMLTAGEQPSAAFALAALAVDSVHLVGIGDCRIIFESHTGEVAEFNPSEVGPAEGLIIQERSRLTAAYPGEDPLPRLKPFMRSIRESVNLEVDIQSCTPLVLGAAA